MSTIADPKALQTCPILIVLLDLAGLDSLCGRKQKEAFPLSIEIGHHTFGEDPASGLNKSSRNQGPMIPKVLLVVA